VILHVILVFFFSFYWLSLVANVHPPQMFYPVLESQCCPLICKCICSATTFWWIMQQVPCLKHEREQLYLIGWRPDFQFVTLVWHFCLWCCLVFLLKYMPCVLKAQDSYTICDLASNFVFDDRMDYIIHGQLMEYISSSSISKKTFAWTDARLSCCTQNAIDAAVQFIKIKHCCSTPVQAEQLCPGSSKK